jgi:probable phosphoglycerate mutase
VPDSEERATRLVLVRHGESECSLSGVVGGPKGCTGLSAKGVAQAEALRDRLIETKELWDAGAVYTSILERAVQTAKIASAGIRPGVPTFSDCDLCELHPGDADGLTWDAFLERYGDPDFDRDPDTPLCPGGESWNGFVARAARALEELASRHRGELVVVFCHAGVIESSLLEFLHVAPERGRLKLRTDQTSLTEWQISLGVSAGNFSENRTGTSAAPRPGAARTEASRPEASRPEASRPEWNLVRYNDAAHLLGLFERGPEARRAPRVGQQA